MHGARHKYPERQRCFKCRKFFDFIVLKRLYCSYECAGHTPPKELPRTCRTAVYRQKKAFLWPGEVPERLKYMDIYECPNCLMYHVATPRKERDAVPVDPRVAR